MLQLIGEYFDETREAMREARRRDSAASRRASVSASRRRASRTGATESAATPPDPRDATMEAYYYLKLMLSAYRDTRPDRDGSEASDGGGESFVRQKSLEYGDAGLGDPRDPDRACLLYTSPSPRDRG